METCCATAGNVVRTCCSLVVAGWSFGLNSCVDLCTGCGCCCCYNTQKKQHWGATLSTLSEYLTATGIDTELSRSTNDPLLSKLRLLSRIQDCLVPSRSDEIALLDAHNVILPSLEEGAAYMRFASAVYGPEMIASVRLQLGLSQALHTQQAIRLHTGVSSTDDILVSDVATGGCTESLRYMVVVDHERKSVVLSIRGTLTLSELVTDAEAFTTDFCGGQAHAGVAKMARAVWTRASEQVRARIDTLPYQDLIITGHSLGGAVACLLTIMCYHDRTLLPPNIRVRCFAFAPPPVFSPIEAAREAQANTIAYVHNNDIIPSLSIYNGRQLFQCLNDLEDANKRLSWCAKAQVYCGACYCASPPPHLVEVVAESRSKPLECVDGSPLLIIPAYAIVWLRKTHGGGCFSRTIVDPVEMQKWGIYVNISNVPDHWVSNYENAFAWMLRHANNDAVATDATQLV